MLGGATGSEHMGQDETGRPSGMAPVFNIQRFSVQDGPGVLFDLKVMDPREHERLTGRSNARILARLAFVDDAANSLIIRVPLIPEITDTVKNLTAIASLASSLKKKPEVHLLPYHPLGESKYHMLDRCYSLSDLKPQSEREIAAMKAIFESFDLECAVIM
jgi:pyruvate formate lyase activating enzyme